MAQDPIATSVITVVVIVPGNGLVPSGTKPLSELQKMAWCLMAPGHYLILNQYWPSSMSTYDIGQWVKIEWHDIHALVAIGSDNGLVLNKHQAITWANADILSIEPLLYILGTNFTLIEISIELKHFS